MTAVAKVHGITAEKGHIYILALPDGRVVKIDSGTITVETQSTTFDFSEPDEQGFVHVFHDDVQIARVA